MHASSGSDCSDDANSAVADRVGDYTCDHGSGDRLWNVGVNTGVARGLKQTHFCVLSLSLEDDAVVERQRPTTSVAHEIGHLLGRPHADLLCGGNDDGQEGEAWPPDDRGYLQSNGLATDNGTGSKGGPFAVMAPPKQWFDYMSYCASKQLGDYTRSRTAPAGSRRATGTGSSAPSSTRARPRAI